MNVKTISTFLLAGLLTLTGCSEDDFVSIGGNDTPPSGALPSGDFLPNALPDAP